MKIKSRIDIHPLYYVVAFISFFTGYFKAFSIYTIIILVHELGHIVAALILKWPIKKVTVYPFGCMTTFDNKLNSSVYEEFLVLIYGPLFQILFNMIYPTDYHYFILFFNLLPIYPLDGSKLLFLILNKITSYYYSYIYIYIISYITLIILLIRDINFINYLILFYLMYDVYRYIKKLDDIMLKFYFERYQYNYKFKKNRIIIGKNKHYMFKEKNNYFFIDNKYYSEHEILRKGFDK
mgnify:CR=1 FL=1